ncbi:MAG: hypothetical protein OXU27_08365 [Candidatus Poribacteria bacterium]|nr:hypothetical protein [Candidatus Poribacteria bacterium]
MNFGDPTSDRSSVTASPPDRDMPDEAVLAAAKDILMDVLVGNDEKYRQNQAKPG